MHADDGAKISKQINMPSKKDIVLDEWDISVIDTALKQYCRRQCEAVRDLVRSGISTTVIQDPWMRSESTIVIEVEKICQVAKKKEP